MSDSDFDDQGTSSTGSRFSRIFSAGPESKCGRAVAGLYIVLFLVILILVGSAIQTGKGKDKNVSWAIFSFALLLGLALIIVLFRGKTKGKTKKRLMYISPLLAIMWIASLATAEPDMSTSQTAIPYIVVILFGILSVVSAISMPAELNDNRRR